MLNNLNQLDQNDHRGHIFIGTVASVDDPLQLERIKVTIPGIFESADPELLPWCGKKDGGPVATQGTTAGSFGLVPAVGSLVYVEFQHGKAEFPLYWSSPIKAGARVPEANVNYPNRYGWKDPAGNVFFVDTTPGQVTLQFIHKSGTTFRINDDGSVNFDAVAPITSSAPVWNHEGDVNVNGTITATVDVIADGVSLVNHTHGGVDTGGGSTAPPN